MGFNLNFKRENVLCSIEIVVVLIFVAILIDSQYTI